MSSAPSPMELALALAEDAAAQGEAPVGAVIVEGQTVLAAERNRMQALADPTAHAEMLAIRTALAARGTGRLDGCDLYVTLEPCAMCAGLMVNARVQRCVYAATDPRGGFLGTLGDLSSHPVLNHRFEVTSGVRAEEAAEMLRSFFRKVRAKK